MTNFAKEFLDWSEAWAPLIPLTIFMMRRPKIPYLKTIFIYLCIALLLNVLIDGIWKGKHYFPVEFKNDVPAFLQDNNFLYNLQSICRLFLLILFFDGLDFKALKIKNHYVLLIAAILIILNFTLWQHFTQFSNTLFSFESIVLLIYSLSYFLYLINRDEVNAAFDPSLLVVTGIAVYEAVNFFIFLFHEALMQQNPVFSAAIWKVHDYVFIVLCLFFAKAFYGERKPMLKLF